MPMPSTTLGLMPKDMDIGVAPIPGPDGGESTFVGGDVIGISATSKEADAAWDFLAWTLGDEAQVEVLAKNKDVVARTDLASNKYSSRDPRVVLSNELVAKGVTPYSLNFGATYNDPTGPWLKVARSAVFGDNLDQALAQGKAALTDSLGQQ
jgi:multiple sugar transport system substrate-binding protein